MITRKRQALWYTTFQRSMRGKPYAMPVVTTDASSRLCVVVMAAMATYSSDNDATYCCCRKWRSMS